MNKWLIALLVILVALGAVFILTSTATDKNPVPQGPNPPDLQIKCGIQECHGPNYTCGDNVPDACDGMYTTADFCRQFISCQVVEGKCQTIAPELAQCATCVKQCSGDEILDDEADCVQKCVENIK